MKTTLIFLALFFSTIFSEAEEKDWAVIAKSVAKSLDTDNTAFKEKDTRQLGLLKMITAKIEVQGVEYNLTWTQFWNDTPKLVITKQGFLFEDFGVKGKLSDSRLDTEYQTALSDIAEGITSNIAPIPKLDLPKKVPEETSKRVARNP